ncbi:hypothetical protein [Paludisphaera sp.]|uniref:hypothetical protein n=1 Tax=Paludisphaera sp. TaxID=2017432 RepID=UPI00301D91F9
MATISMHCPSCGAEGRIPRDKVNVRMLCKRCLKSFHLTPGGKILAGGPPIDPATAGHGRHVDELEVVDHEIEVVVGKLKSAAPKVAIAGGVLLALLLGWLLLRGGEVASLDDQTIRLARALARNDLDELRSLAVDGTDDEAAELSQALAPEFRDHAEIPRAASPSVHVSRHPESPGPGLAAITATIRADQPVGRMGVALPDISTSMKSASIEVPMVLAGDDRRGWRLDGERSLEAYRKSRAPAPAARPGMPMSPSPRSTTTETAGAL